MSASKKIAKGPWVGPFADFSDGGLDHPVYGDNNGHIFSDLTGSPVSSMSFDLNRKGHEGMLGTLVAAAPANNKNNKLDEDGARHKTSRNHLSEVEFAHNKGASRGHNGAMVHTSSKRGEARRRAAGCMHGLQQPTRGVN